MRRALLAAGALLIFSAPAFADEVTIEKRTITREATPESGSTVSTVIVAPSAPPAPEMEPPPPPPGPNLAWRPGHWYWNAERQAYVWHKGDYMEPPRAKAAWIPGRFQERAGGWVWEDGHWD